MKTIYLEIENKQVKTEKLIVNDLLWFDPVEKVLKNGKGGVLVYKFNMKEKRLIPEIEDLKVISYTTQSNKNIIKNWIESNKNLFDIEIDQEDSKNNIIVINVKDEEESEIMDLLDRAGIRYS